MMNKAIPWNINGVGFDAREAAREAARREGKSLGEWLHGVIADHAVELGVGEDDVVGRDRIDAVTSRLERMSTRAAAFDRPARDNRSEGRPAARRRAEDDGRDAEGSHRRDRWPETSRTRPSASLIEETETLLEEAIDAMESRARRAEQRTDKALESFEKLLQRNEEKRESERLSVSALTQKLSDIESRLPDRDQSHVKGALARLEARLDVLGRRGTGEAGALSGPAQMSTANGTPDPIRSLENKINIVLDAIGKGAPVSSGRPDSSVTSPASHPVPRRRLGDAIAEISNRQRTLDGPRASGLAMRYGRAGRIADATLPREPEHAPAAIAAVQSDIAALNAKIDDLHGAIRRNAAATPGLDFGGLQDQIAAMTQTLGDVVQRGLEDRRAGADARREEAPAFGQIKQEIQQIRDLISAASARPVDLEPIESQIAALTSILDQQARRPADQDAAALAIRALEQQIRKSPSRDADIASLETLVRDLGTKIEAVQAPGAGAGAIDALQTQIAALAKRFERSEAGLASLAGLEHSMRDLFIHLEDTRGNIEAAAVRAARDAVRMAADETRDDNSGRSHPEIVALRTMQEEADQRTHSTLEAVHGTLEKVVDRLTTMESEIAEVRAMPKPPRAVEQQRPRPTPEARDQPAKAPMAVEPGALVDPLFGRSNERVRKQPDHAKGRSSELDEEGGRADFIAAARRAAQAAQKDTSFSALRPPESALSDDDERASLITRSRDYVAAHKRPVLLGMAAIFVIVGTMAIVQNIGSGDTIETADYAAPAKIVTSMNAPARAVAPRADTALNVLTPSALPLSAPALNERIPGSDPIQTGSIPSLPAFAAHSGVAKANPQQLPAGLVMMADAGNSAADFELGSRYAEGKSVARDYKLAAKYYTKAADQGVVPAQYRLASLYEKGLGVAQDKIRAKSLYLAAAEAGNPRAMHNLAVLLADGNGKPDLEGAATWFRKAAQFGVHDSQYNLAILLARGLGVEQSFVQSYQWFAVAAAQNDLDAATKRDEIANKLSASDLSVAKALASSFRPRSPNPAAVDVPAPPGGWDGAAAASPLNSAKSKVSSL